MSESKDGTLTKLCLRTTSHGPRDLWESRGWCSRLCWGLIVLGTYVAIGYYSYFLVVQFFDKPSATSIIDIAVDRLQFPNVTVCNSARYNSTFVTENIRVPPEYLPMLPVDEETFKRQYYRYLRVLSYSPELFTDDQQDLVYALQLMYDNMFNKSVNSDAVDVLQFVKQATPDCRQYMVECKFGDKSGDCCAAARMAFTDYGYCYTINMMTLDSNRTDGYQSGKGSDFGFETTLKMNLSDLGLINDWEVAGVRVHITNYATLLDFNPVGVAWGMHAFISLSPVRYVLEPGTDACLAEPKPLTGQEYYTRELCEVQCYIHLIWERCGCNVIAGFTEPDSTTICTPLQMLLCVFPYKLSNDDRTLYEDQLLKCFREECPKLCNYWIYGAQITYTILEDSTPLDGNYSQNRELTTKLNVYFEEMVYSEHQKQLLMDVDTFISNLGGIVGLWSGISVLTVVQCFVIIIFGPCEEDGCCSSNKSKKTVINYPSPHPSDLVKPPIFTVADLKRRPIS